MNYYRVLESVVHLKAIKREVFQGSVRVPFANVLTPTLNSVTSFIAVFDIDTPLIIWIKPPESCKDEMRFLRTDVNVRSDL